MKWVWMGGFVVLTLGLGVSIGMLVSNHGSFLVPIAISWFLQRHVKSAEKHF